VEVKESVAEDVAEECLLKAVVKLGDRENVHIQMYKVNLDVE